jgi:hypothetical protein
MIVANPLSMIDPVCGMEVGPAIMSMRWSTRERRITSAPPVAERNSPRRLKNSSL